MSLTYDGKDALMAHQAAANRAASTDVTNLMTEYMTLCAMYADTKEARTAHAAWIEQVEALRALLTTQRRTSAGSAGFTIVKQEWTKEYFKKLRIQWNAHGLELIPLITEAAVAWLIQNTAYEGYENMKFFSGTSCYVSNMGLVLQQWADIRDAKGYVNSLHAIVNAPSSQFFTPFACTLEILGTAIVAISVPPVYNVWDSWKDLPMVMHALSSVMSTLRFIKPTGSRDEDIFPVIERMRNIRLSPGGDGRWYALDVRDLPHRGQTIGPTEAAQRKCPRREALFSANGVCSTPYGANELIVKFKLKPVVEQLLATSDKDGLNKSDLTATGNTISEHLHQNGIPFSPFIYQLYHAVGDQERVFATGLQTANRREVAMSQAVVQKLQRFQACKSTIVSEVFARAIKELIKEEWRRALSSSGFVANLRRTIEEAEQEPQDEGEEQALEEKHKASIREISRPFIEALNMILQALFVKGIGKGKKSAVAAPSDPLVLQVAEIGISPEVFDELLFIVNDVFVRRAIGERAGGNKFTVTAEQVDAPRVISTLSYLLGVPITVRQGRAFVEEDVDIFETFFDLESAQRSPLRSDAVATVLEIPVCLVAGSRAKMSDYVALQQRIATRILSTMISGVSKEVSAYHVFCSKHILLHATDVMVAQRGFIQDQDYEDVLQAQSTIVHITMPMQLAKLEACIEVEVALKRAYFLATVDLQQCLRVLMKYSEKTRPLIEGATGTLAVLAQKIRVLCLVCEQFHAPALLSALETLLQDALALSDFERIGIAHATKSYELRVIHGGYLMLNLLSMLVRHVLLPDPNRTQSEGLALAVKYASKRRDVVKAIHGELSVETGVACNDIAAICSNNKYDFDRAQSEFERAVLILSEAQPEGPAVFITMNNLAFLYFRKAERLRKNPPPAMDLAAARVASSELLIKAESLLKDVLAAEQSVTTLDLAAALNNLASVMLFENRFVDARIYFMRTLEITDSLKKEVGDDLPARVHAMKNLKVLARKQYLATVVKVQAMIRRFLTRLQTRKGVVFLRNIQPIQRLCRGFQVRNALAIRYRFSAYYCWLRQPTAFTKKLDKTCRKMPLEQRKSLWVELMECKAALLQRSIRGFRERQLSGEVWNFQRAFLTVRRVAVTDEINRRMALLVSAECLTLTANFSLMRMQAIIDIQIRATTAEMWLVVADMNRRREKNWCMLWDEDEASRRDAVAKEERRLRRIALQHQEALDALAIAERRRRTCLLSDHYENLHFSLTVLIWAQERRAFRTDIQFAKQLDFTERLEQRTRSNIEVEFLTIIRGEKFMAYVPRIGRGFIARRWLQRIRLLHRNESIARTMVRAEEALSLSFDNLNRDWRIALLVCDEGRRRGGIVQEVAIFFDFHDETSLEAIDVRSFEHFCVLLHDSGAEWATLMHQERLSRLLVRENDARQLLFVHAALASLGLVEKEEDIRFATLAKQHALELQGALRRSFEFAVTYLSAQEHAARHTLLVQQASIFLVGPLYETGAAKTADRERSERGVLCADISSALRAQREHERVVRKNEFERFEVQQEEAVGRRGVDGFAMNTSFWNSAVVDALFLLRKNECESQHLLLAQVIEREALDQRASLEKGFLCLQTLLLSAIEMMVDGEAALRSTVLEACAVSQNHDLSHGSRRNLVAIAMAASSKFINDEARSDIVHFEALEFLELQELLHRSNIENEFYSHEAYFSIKIEQLSMCEGRQRRELVCNGLVAALLLLEERCCGQRSVFFAESMAERAASMMEPGVLEEEGFFRRWAVELEQSNWDRQCRCDVAEVKARQHLQLDADTELVSSYLVLLHSRHVLCTLWPKTTALTSNCATLAITQATAMQRTILTVRLQRCCRAGMLRKRLNAKYGRLKRAALLWQRTGRGYFGRVAVAFGWSDNVERCCLIASEAVGRLRLEGDENNARTHIRRAWSWSGTKFLIQRKSIIGGPDRVPRLSSADVEAFYRASPPPLAPFAPPKPPHSTTDAAGESKSHHHVTVSGRPVQSESGQSSRNAASRLTTGENFTATNGEDDVSTSHHSNSGKRTEAGRPRPSTATRQRRHPLAGLAAVPPTAPHPPTGSPLSSAPPGPPIALRSFYSAPLWATHRLYEASHTSPRPAIFRTLQHVAEGAQQDFGTGYLPDDVLDDAGLGLSRQQSSSASRDRKPVGASIVAVSLSAAAVVYGAPGTTRSLIRPSSASTHHRDHAGRCGHRPASQPLDAKGGDRIVVLSPSPPAVPSALTAFRRLSFDSEGTTTSSAATPK